MQAAQTTGRLPGRCVGWQDGAAPHGARRRRGPPRRIRRWQRAAETDLPKGDGKDSQPSCPTVRTWQNWHNKKEISTKKICPQSSVQRGPRQFSQLESWSDHATMAYASITLHTLACQPVNFAFSFTKSMMTPGCGTVSPESTEMKPLLQLSWNPTPPPASHSHLRHVGPPRWRPRSKSSNTQLHQGTQLGLVDKCSINEYPSTRGCENRRSTNLILTSLIYTLYFKTCTQQSNQRILVQSPKPSNTCCLGNWETFCPGLWCRSHEAFKRCGIRLRLHHRLQRWWWETLSFHTYILYDHNIIHAWTNQSRMFHNDHLSWYPCFPPFLW